MNSPDVSSLAARAQACVDAGKATEARKLFKELCRVEPRNAEAWLMAGALYGETGSTEEAFSCLNAAIRVAPDYPEAHLTLAHLHKSRGALDLAYESAKRAVEIDADYDEAWVFLGALCCDLNRFEEAERASREALKRWPENVQAHISLASALCNQGHEDEAEPLVRNARDLEGGKHPMVSALLGRILLSKSDYTQAEPLLQTALAAAPDDVALLLNMAKLRGGQGLFDEAETLFRTAIERSPQSAEVWAGLGNLLHQGSTLGRPRLNEAEEAYRKAISLNPSLLSPAINLALLQEAKGQLAAAADTLRSILARRPSQLEAIGALAGVLEKQGEFDEAIQMLEPVLASPERNVYVAQVFERLCKKMGRCTEAGQYLEDVLSSLPENSAFGPMIHFSLGNMYDREGKYDLAFERFEKGNNAKAQFYDPGKFTDSIDETMRAFSPSAFASLPVSGKRSELPVFILGMPRSGTSLVERVLSSHTAVFGSGELRDLYDLTEEVAALAGEGKRFPAGVEQLTQADVDRMSEKYLQAISTMAGGAIRITDKMPHNYQCIGLIRVLFPRAKIIHCVRDARDTCLSSYFQDFFGYHPYAQNLEHLGRHYRDYQRLMGHWRSLDIPMLEVPYEEMVEDPEAWARKLVEYCGLDWEEQCLRYYESDQVTRTASYDQVRQPIYKGSVGRWKKYESHLSPLFKGLGNSVLIRKSM